MIKLCIMCNQQFLLDKWHPYQKICTRKKCQKLNNLNRQKTHRCIDCKKLIRSVAIRCKSCAGKLKIGKLNANYKHGRTNSTVCKKCGKLPINSRAINQLCLKCFSKSRKGYKHTEETILKIKNTFDKHHINLDRKNNKKSNLMFLASSIHQSLHRNAYRYLIEVYGLKEIKKYIKWFLNRGQR